MNIIQTGIEFKCWRMSASEKISAVFSANDALNSAYLAAIVESCDDGVIGKDLSGVVQSWNRAAETMFGYRACEMIGASIEILFPTDRLFEEHMILEKIRAGLSVDHYETVRRKKCGAEFPVSVTISPIRARDGSIVGASKIVRDVTARDAAHKELLKAKEALERVVAEKTAALAERDLLLREVHHRVKNNLQVVDGLLMFESLKIQDPTARAGLGDVRFRLFALARAHQELMASSNMRTFDVAPFLREVAAHVLCDAADQQKKLTVEACPLEVDLDFAAPLGLLVAELVVDALRRPIGDGGGEVRVGLHADGSGALLLTVGQEGAAHRCDEPTLKTPGREFSIVRSLVAQLRGQVRLERRAGPVTEITIPLPETTWPS